MSTETRLNKAFELALKLPLNEDSRYVLFSDCHRGIGTSNDNFIKHQYVFYAALQHYYNDGFTYIELGDGDELWENRKLKPIVEVYSNIYWLLSQFRGQKRLHLIYGNHDMVKRKSDYCKEHLSSYFCTDSQCQRKLMPGIGYHEGIILENSNRSIRNIYLTHGHQASCLNSVFWRLARFLVRYVWAGLERHGYPDPTSAAKNYEVKERVEQRLTDWAVKHDVLLITGHTHRSVLEENSPYYANTGSCIHPRCITCIEICEQMIRLVKWFISTDENQRVYIAREVLNEIPQNQFTVKE